MKHSDKVINSRFNKLFEKSLKKSRKCYYPNCNEQAINSHILQKNGILSGISENGHIYVLKTDFLNTGLFHFKKSGINVTYTFKGFCKYHDKEVFKEIEDYEIDFDNYLNQLLFAYRTILNEKRKKEVLLDWYNYQKNDEVLKYYLIQDYIEKSIYGNKQAINDLVYYEKAILSDLNSNNESFIFKVRYVKQTDICLASHFTFETTRQMQETIIKTGKDIKILTDIFISFFPLENESVLIVGFLKENENTCKEFVNNLFEIITVR
jgi:hypothetical protein